MTVHLITGAGSGIGGAVARRLHDRGDDLVLLARDAGRAREIAARFPGAAMLVGDLAQPGRLSWSLSKQHLPDRIESLVHVAGVVDLGSLGVADPWADLAVAAWSTEWNFGPGYAAEVYAAYGTAPDEERIAYYSLLWDLT